MSERAFKRRLAKVYEGIPTIKGGCGTCQDCCRGNPPLWGPAEVTGIIGHPKLSDKQFIGMVSETGWIKDAFGKNDLIGFMIADKDGKPIPCPFVTPDGCGVYELRPLACRMFGVIEGGADMKCPKGKSAAKPMNLSALAVRYDRFKAVNAEIDIKDRRGRSLPKHGL